jgi:folylpolyglutamate synthase/dihydropteroate synthase
MRHRALRALNWLQHLINYETSGIPAGAGTASSKTWDLSRMHSLLHSLGDPHNQLQNVIHIVGTKGKGSVAAFLDTTLRAGGLSVGSYSSPHLACDGERISIGA